MYLLNICGKVISGFEESFRFKSKKRGGVGEGFLGYVSSWSRVRFFRERRYYGRKVSIRQGFGWSSGFFMGWVFGLLFEFIFSVYYEKAIIYFIYDSEFQLVFLYSIIGSNRTWGFRSRFVKCILFYLLWDMFSIKCWGILVRRNSF